jgi:dTMP kinase
VIGKLIVFEGPDGVGKSTLAQWFATRLEKSGIRCTLLSFPGKEPGSLGRHVYELHHDPSRFGIESLSQASLQLLHVAAHIDAIETRIKPLIGDGAVVVLDRFWWSTYVYGKVGGVPQSVLDRMIDLERAAWQPLLPDRVFVISRTTPLRPEPMSLWPLWVDAYGSLAKQEASVHPVIAVANEMGLNEAQERILKNI